MNDVTQSEGWIDFPHEIAGEGAPGDAVKNFVATLPKDTTHISLRGAASSLGAYSSDGHGVNELVVSVVGKTPEEIENTCRQRIGSLVAARRIAERSPLPEKFLHIIPYSRI